MSGDVTNLQPNIQDRFLISKRNLSCAEVAALITSAVCENFAECFFSKLQQAISNSLK